MEESCDSGCDCGPSNTPHLKQGSGNWKPEWDFRPSPNRNPESDRSPKSTRKLMCPPRSPNCKTVKIKQGVHDGKSYDMKEYDVQAGSRYNPANSLSHGGSKTPPPSAYQVVSRSPNTRPHVRPCSSVSNHSVKRTGGKQKKDSGAKNLNECDVDNEGIIKKIIRVLTFSPRPKKRCGGLPKNAYRRSPITSPCPARNPAPHPYWKS